MHTNTMNANAAFQYCSKGEAQTARRLIRLALAKGYSISVNDGEEWVVKQSRDAQQIAAAMNSTDNDTLRFRLGTEVIGSAWIIYGNASDGSELIADYSVSPAMDALYNEATR